MVMILTMAIRRFSGGRKGCIGFRFLRKHNNEDNNFIHKCKVPLNVNNKISLYNIYYKESDLLIGTNIVFFDKTTDDLIDSIFCPSKNVTIKEIIEE